MTISTSAFGKANAAGPRRLHVATITRQRYSTSPASAPKAHNIPHPQAVEAATQRELFVHVLHANATKRDAKQYLSRFQDGKSRTSRPSSDPVGRVRSEQQRLDRSGVNLGGLYSATRAIAENPQFVRDSVAEHAAIPIQETIHVALVLLRAPQALDDATLDGVALTLSQLIKLDMRILIVLDCNSLDAATDTRSVPSHDSTALFGEQSSRLHEAIARHSSEGARVVTGAVEIQSGTGSGNDSGAPKATVAIPNLLLDPLRRSIVPIVPTTAYTSSGQLVSISASSLMVALTHLLSNLPRTEASGRAGGAVQKLLDRIILLDAIGGIPSNFRGGDAHVFVNLQQEFGNIQKELAEHPQPLAGSRSVAEQHIQNLETVRDCLALLPSASSALIISPQEAASSSQTEGRADNSIGAGTRRQKNPLIHNLLTNKPMVSSSLPVARLPSFDLMHDPDNTAREAPRSTLVKRGMPLTIIPDALHGEAWGPPSSGTTSLNLETDPRIDLSRLVNLIEDSFRRKINLQHYLDRIKSRTAGLVIAGSYEGGAIFTWEQPPGTDDPSRLVPYLDKFAVLSSSQGSSGVADILFQTMVRTCFPGGVCWRSRKDNPVNKWYFERADGHWQIPGTNWTMFWTGDGIEADEQRWEDYIGVCRSVGPSWQDARRPD